MSNRKATADKRRAARKGRQRVHRARKRKQATRTALRRATTGPQVLHCTDCDEYVRCTDCETPILTASYTRLPDGTFDLPFPLTCPECGGVACCPSCKLGTVDTNGHMIEVCDGCDKTAPLNTVGLCETCASKRGEETTA